MKYSMVGEETERLLFRKLTQSDYQDWLPFHKDPRSTQYWSGLPQNPELACTEQFQRTFERYEQDLGGMCALVSKDHGELIGLCGLLLQQVDAIEALEIGYSILPKYWKKDYATEAAKQCKESAFKQQWADYLISIIQVDNLPSQKVAYNLGMSLEKTTSYKGNRVHIFRIDR